jgi:hypothetical protein
MFLLLLLLLQQLHVSATIVHHHQAACRSYEIATYVMLYGLGCISELSQECGCVGECGGHKPLWFNLSLYLSKSNVQVYIYVLLSATVAYSVGLFIPVCHILTTLQDL